EAGQAGGVEALAFGALVFIAGTLMVANAWSVIDAKFAVSGAAAQGAATYVETGTDGNTAEPAARRAASAAMAGRGRPGDIEVVLGASGYRRCGRVTVRVTTRVPILRVPFVGGGGGRMVVVGTDTRLVDPLRSGVPGEARCSP